MDFKTHLKKYLTDQQIDSLIASLNQDSKHAVLLNHRKMKDKEFLFSHPYVIPHPITPHAFIYDKNIYDLGKSLEHELGAFYLQEPSAMTVSSLLTFSEDDVVLDLCAAPGGKSIQASFLMNNQGLIIANDISRARSGKILENIERLGIGNTMIVSNDFSSIYQNYRDTFDKIILDVPCSGSGMFRKNDLVKMDWTYEKVLRCQEVQKQLILIAYEMLKPGGVLSYSTCSFSYEEDEEVIEYLLANSDAQVLPIVNNKLFYTTKIAIGVHLFPHLFPGEGQYICHIKKPSRPFSMIRLPVFATYDKSIPGCSNVLCYGSTLFGVSKFFPIKGLSIIRYGIKIGDVSGQIIKYDVHYARYIDTFDQQISLNHYQSLEYLKGNYISSNTPRGFVLLKYNSLNIDIAKSDGKIIKNRYPKYLRKNIVT